LLRRKPNVPKEATDDELRALAKKYAAELDCVALHGEEGDGSRPGAALHDHPLTAAQTAVLSG